MDWYGPKQWDGWGGGPVPYPKPPEWHGPPARGGHPLVRRAATMALAALLGATGLVVVLKLRSPAPSPQQPTGNRSNAGAPVVPSAPPSQDPSQAADQATPTPTGTFDAAAVVSSVKKSVVTITSTLGQSNTRVAGTGAIVSNDGLVLISDHVVAGATSISGVTAANGRTFQASVVGFDRSRDIALLQLAGATGLPKVTVANSSSVNVNDPIVAVGNAVAGGGPVGVTGSVAALNQSITAGQPGGGGSQRLDGLIQVAADVQSGDLGGPVVDQSGRVIGINAAAPVDQAQGGGKGFAIPINTALGIAQQILSGNDSATVHIGPTALLGVSTADANGQVSGAAVTGLVSGGPAQRAGLNVGDVIRSVDGRGIGSVTALTAVLDTHHPGDQVEVDWVDGGGRSRKATVRLATGAAG
jgi:S1-C subfamily serine protease